MSSPEGQVTLLLKAMNRGDKSAADQLLPLVYTELHRLARGYMSRERRDHTLQPTALINQAYLRIAQQELAKIQVEPLYANLMKVVAGSYEDEGPSAGGAARVTSAGGD